MMRALPNSKSLWHKVIVDAQKLSVGGYLLIGSLLAIMAGGFLFIYLAWYLGQETYIPAFGYAAMAGGVVFSLALGFGLMALTITYWLTSRNSSYG
jgi:hypothetical protein